MDNAVALVQAYLQLNGYFTVIEYPVIEAMRNENYRMSTDLDVLAFRFPGSGHALVGDKKETSRFVTDPELECPTDYADMIIAEVKEGRAELNHGATNPDVICTALKRFGCCQMDEVETMVKTLIRKGRVITPANHQLRLLAFGTSGEKPSNNRYKVIYLGHVLEYLQDYLRKNWSILKHAQFKHPAFGLMVTMEKALQGKYNLVNKERTP